MRNENSPFEKGKLIWSRNMENIRVIATRFFGMEMIAYLIML